MDEVDSGDLMVQNSGLVLLSTINLSESLVVVQIIDVLEHSLVVGFVPGNYPVPWTVCK